VVISFVYWRQCEMRKRLCALVPFRWYGQLQRKLEFKVLVKDLEIYITLPSQP